MAVRLSALRAGRPLPPGRFLALISVRGCVNPRAIVRLEGLGHMKNSMASTCKPYLISKKRLKFLIWMNRNLQVFNIEMVIDCWREFSLLNKQMHLVHREDDVREEDWVVTNV
jgi:hypothetical protein